MGPSERENTSDVLVVGAGPTGLLLAGDLAKAGVRVTLLEKRQQAESNLTRSFTVHARTLEVLDARALGDELVALGKCVGQVRVFGEARLMLSDLPTRFPFALASPQYNIERLLQRRAEEAGVRIVRGAEVAGLRPHADAVDLDTTDQGSYRGSYVVGCDGVRSAVRQLIGMPFPGKTVLSSVVLADVLLEEIPVGRLGLHGNEHGFVFTAPFGDGWYRVIGRAMNDSRGEDVPATEEELSGLMRSVHGTDFGMHDPRWISRFHSDERQAPHYRDGRVFLAGDAAHVHSPAGGLGLNTGVQDAANLSWKLAAVIQGRADEPLLDTYEKERHPVGRTVLRISGGIVRGAVAQSGGGGRLPRVVLPALARIDAVRRYLAGQVSGVRIAYRAPRGSHRLVGKRAPDLPLADGLRLYEALRDGGFVLVTEGKPVKQTAWLRVFPPADSMRTTLLVRPDGYVAWAAENPEPEHLRAAIGQWPVAER
jgi:2-polyprenyl-6-methoxyphenol hydroxylase-like FAD-dependent oxidoreductase